MFRRPALNSLLVWSKTPFVSRQLIRMSSSGPAASSTPMEDAIRTKITSSFKPSKLDIYNDSHKHAHHAAMRDSTSAETHFRLVIVSDAFKDVRLQAQRHRLVYQLLRDEMAAEGGIHALQLRTVTPAEEEARRAKEEAQGA